MAKVKGSSVRGRTLRFNQAVLRGRSLLTYARHQATTAHSGALGIGSQSPRVAPCPTHAIDARPYRRGDAISRATFQVRTALVRTRPPVVHRAANRCLKRVCTKQVLTGAAFAWERRDGRPLRDRRGSDWERWEGEQAREPVNFSLDARSWYGLNHEEVRCITRARVCGP